MFEVTDEGPIAQNSYKFSPEIYQYGRAYTSVEPSEKLPRR